MSNAKWMLYGAYGQTGMLIAEEAVRRGQRPLLAGRSKERLVPLAERLGLEWLAVERDTEEFRQAVADVDLVFQAAGPFGLTSEPVIQACLAGGTHYADIANEIPIFHMAQKYDEEARQRGICLMTGAGFGVIAADCLAKYVADQVPQATELEVAIVIYSSVTSAGATKSGLDMLREGGFVWRDGKLVQQRIGAEVKRVRFPDKERTLIPAPFGELEALHMTTGIPNITVYSSALPSDAVTRTILPVLGRALNIDAFRRLVEGTIDRQAQRGGEQKHVETGKSYIWAQARNQAGNQAQAWLEMGEGYLFSAAASVRAAEQILARRPVGTITPAQAFGTEIVLEIPGTQRYSSLPSEVR